MHKHKVIINKAPTETDLLVRGSMVLHAIGVKNDKLFELKTSLFLANEDPDIVEHQIKCLLAEINGLEECIKDFDDRFINNPSLTLQWEIQKLHLLDNLTKSQIAERMGYDRTSIYRLIKKMQKLIEENQ